MIRTRHVAGMVTAALISLPFIAAGSASAGTVSVTGGTIRAGDTLHVVIDPESDAGPYTAKLMDDDGSTVVATVGSGPDLTGVTSIDYLIPEADGAFVGSGFTIRVDSTDSPSAFTSFSTTAFDIDIELGSITAPGTIVAGTTLSATFDKGGETGAYTIELQDSGNATVAAVSDGLDIASLASPITFAIPAYDAAYVGTGFKLVIMPVTPGAFANITSNSFAITAASDGDVTVSGPLQTGDTETISFADGPQTGGYKVELWKASAKVATLKTGDNITTLGSSMKWTIPTGVTALKGEGFTVKVVKTDGTAFSPALASASFTIESSAFKTVAASDSTWPAGSTREITWVNAGATGGLVDISLVGAKTTVLAKAVANTGSYELQLPMGTATGSYKFKVSPVKPFDKLVTAGESASVTVGAPDEASVNVDDNTLTRGQSTTVWASVDEPNVQVKLDLVLLSAPTKSVVAIAKAANDGDEFTLTIPAKLALGDYAIAATVVGSKPAVVNLDEEIEVIAASAIELTDVTLATLDEDVVKGQTVTVKWESDADGSVTVKLTGGAKAIVLDAKEVTVDGEGSYSWLVDSKLTAGSAYKIEVTNNVDTAVKVESPVFSISANPTTLATS